MSDQNSSTTQFPIQDLNLIKSKVLNWVQQFDTFCFLDNNRYGLSPHSEECIIAAGIQDELITPPGAALSSLRIFTRHRKRWLFGHLAYDLKNEIETLQSTHPDHIDFPDLYFFEPLYIIRINASEMQVIAEFPDSIHQQILDTPPLPEVNTVPSLRVRPRFTKEEYIRTINRLKDHILRGDCYEINFCHEFYAEDATLNPVACYRQLNKVSPNPFSALYRLKDKWLLCASPERFIARKQNTIISQPIKGTSPRDLNDPGRDIFNKELLQQSDKDRSENVMVVDLVRNDLSRVCKEGTVKVDELFGIYSFPQVHQMISTISGELRSDIAIVDIIRALFPMGSMTGAPKKRVMELIEEYERTKRGIFSGALGYITPEDEFDFNVVIRSIMYNETNAYVSFLAGSGITFNSEAASEWEECLMKATAMKAALGIN